MLEKLPFKSKSEYSFLFGVGGAYLFALSRVIITSTHIQTTPVQLYLTGLLCLAAATVILFNRVTRIAAALLVVLVAAFILYREELREVVFLHFEDVFLMVTGYLHFQPELGSTLLWLIVGALAFATVILMLQRFNFILLTATGVTIFTLTWLSSFVRDGTSFFVFLFVFILLLVRKMNGRINTAKFAAIPALIIILAAQMNVPVYSEMYTRRTLRDAFEGRFTAVQDFLFELFNPTYFSFAQTGFSGGGGLLGGPVTPNHNIVMEVYAPGMLYLSGATHNYFTGYAWRTTLEEGDICTHGMLPGHFEMLENTAALMSGTAFRRELLPITMAMLRQQFPDEQLYNLTVRDYVVAMMTEQMRLAFRPYDDEPPGWTPPGGFPRSVFIEAQPRYTYTFLNVYLPLQTVSIALGRNRTGTVFRPSGMRQMWFYSGTHDYSPMVRASVMGDMRTPGMMRRGTVYHHQFLHINPNIYFMQELLHSAYAGAYTAMQEELYAALYELFQGEMPQHEYFHPLIFDELIDEFARHLPGVAGNVRLLGDLEEFQLGLAYSTMRIFSDYAASVREHFLQVPDITPRRVHALTRAIVQHETTDFGRVTAIRNFLTANFNYTLTPVNVPRGVCFVDFFLFEGREGYCTYFATAMTVMSRIAGVPARYVEGFFVQGESRHQSTATVVTNRMAHAWSEVYLEGFGWLIMEATPPYHAAGMELGFAPGVNRPDGWHGSPWDDDMLDPYWFPDFGGFVPDADVTEVVTPDDEPETRSIRSYVILFAGGLAVLLLGGAWIYLLAGRLRFAYAMRKIGKYDANKQVQIYFKGILDISQYYHLQMQKGETTLAYARRAGKRFAFRSDSVFLRDLIALYNRARYSPRTMSDEDVTLMRESYLNMLELLKQMRRRRFTFLRYVKKIGELSA